ncbi:MAG: tetratricopeptide repeat protein [Alphaproteobacteria bacterium]|jgi:tetratricopeptide (TPR) repeat protein|nr:tetratricopeptide repeat protein [Alphaproteobacteria bacterium]
MRGNLVLVALLAVGSLLLAWAMIPSPMEIAAMQLRDFDYDPAQAYFEAQYDQGDRSPQIVGRLADLYLELGDPDRAQQVLAGYVTAHPRDLSALRRFADVQYLVRDYSGLRASLEKLAAVEPDIAILRRLANIAVMQNDGVRRTRWLRGLMQRGAVTDEEVTELTLRLAARDKAEARAVLADWLTRKPSARNTASLQLLASLAADIGDTTALEQAGRMALSAGGMPMFLTLIAVVAERDKPRLALDLARSAVPAGEAMPPPLATRAAQIELTDGRPQNAYALLLPLLRANTIERDALITLIDAAISQRDTATALAAALRYGVADLPRDRLRGLLSFAQGQGRERVLALDAQVTAAQRQADPLLAAELAAALGLQDESRRALARIDQPEALPLNDRLAYAGLALRLGDRAGALPILAAVAEDADVPTAVLGELGRLYLDLGRAADGLPLFRRLRTTRPGGTVLTAWAELEATAGDPAAVEQWLGTGPEVDRQTLQDLYWIGRDRGRARLSMLAVDQISRRFPGTLDPAMQARALLDGGDAAGALAIAEPMAGRGGEAEAVYIAALARLGRDGEAKRYLVTRLADPHSDEARITALAQALADLPGPLPADAAAVTRLADDIRKAAIAPAARDARLVLLDRLDPAVARQVAAALAQADPDGATPTVVTLVGPDAAFELLLRQLRQDRLSPDLSPLLVQLAFDRGQTALAEQVARRTGLGPLADDLARALIARAVAERHGDVLAQWDQEFPPAAREARPLVAVALDLAFGRNEAAQRRIDALMHIAADPGTAPATVISIADALVAMGRAAQAVAVLDQARRNAGDPALAIAWARIAARRGDGAKVAAWLGATRPADPLLLRDIYYAAVEAKSFALATTAADQLLQLEPGADNSLLYAQALAGAGRKPALRDFLLRRMARTDLTTAQRTEMGWLLVEALPGAAPDENGTLARIIDEELERRTLTPQVEDQRLAILAAISPQRAARRIAAAAEDPQATREQRRNLAGRLLALGGKAMAEPVYRRLAAGQPPDSPDVAELLFLWGPAPTAGELAWLTDRARNAAPASRDAWARLLLERGAPERVLSLVEALPPEAVTPALDQVYVEALAQGGRAGNRIGLAIQRAIVRNAPTAQLVALGTLAEGEQVTGAANAAWNAILARDPDSGPALRGLARLAFAEGRRRDAIALYQRLLTRNAGTWPDHYQLGELLLARGDRAAARPEQQKALALIDAERKPDPAAATARAQLLYRLGRTDEALAAFEAQRRARPRDKDLLADYVGVLMELGRNGEAARLLGGNAS